MNNINTKTEGKIKTNTDLGAKHYYALLIATFALLFIGIVMILSASTTVSYKQFDNQYVIFLRQLLFASIGVILMLAISRLPKIFYFKWANFALIISLVLLVLSILIPKLVRYRVSPSSASRVTDANTL